VNRKGQVSLEFVFIFTFAVIIFVLLLAIIIQYVDYGRDTRILKEYEFVADSILRNLLIAAKGPGEVTLMMTLPLKIGNQDYRIIQEKTDIAITGTNIIIIESEDKKYTVKFAIPEIESSSEFVPGKDHSVKNENGKITIVQA
jgi:hypothetical protein